MVILKVILWTVLHIRSSRLGLDSKRPGLRAGMVVSFMAAHIIGELFDMFQFTAAHKTMPIPAWIHVTNLENNKSLVVRVNDRVLSKRKSP